MWFCGEMRRTLDDGEAATGEVLGVALVDDRDDFLREGESGGGIGMRTRGMERKLWTRELEDRNRGIGILLLVSTNLEQADGPQRM